MPASRNLFSHKTNIAATSFLRYNHPRHGVQPPRGHPSLWLEEQKLTPVEEAGNDGR